MEKVMFREAERWTQGIHDCFEIVSDGVIPISQAKCMEYINSPKVKCYGKNENGYVVYGK